MNMNWREKLGEKMEFFMSSKNILACDIGLKRIGIATQINGILLPLTPILRKNRLQAAKELSNLLKQKNIQTLVVGIPKTDNEEEHQMERRIRHFITLIEFQGEICFVDESLSSQIAQERLYILSKKERAEKIKNGELDSLSAVVILERYLQRI